MINYFNFLTAKHWALILTGFVFCYFIYHTYHGERGLIAQDKLSKELENLTQTHQKLYLERVNLENKINSLGSGDAYIDPDLLSEYAKKMGYISPNEILITQ